MTLENSRTEAEREIYYSSSTNHQILLFIY